MTTAQRWQRLQALFHASCELPREARTAFARAEAGDDPQLLDELLAMLDIEADATFRLQASITSASTLVEPLLAPSPGTRFGPWAILRPLGSGGMGQVFLAHRADGAYEREVALKLMSVGGLNARQQAFFEVERQLLAQMHHPVIAQIHDAGTDAQGRPWLVMEYIEGERITTYCEENGLSIRRRIELFLRLCEGVQHAHQKGVVHRDIKPGNVLVHEVDGVAMPSLIDFGIASNQGHTNQPAGTPGYMSPEQADASHYSDSRSDIYSLGALLYELVSGSRPPTERSDQTTFPSRWLESLDSDKLHALARKRGLDPSRLLRSLREDLDWVIVKAMQPDPEQRYKSVSLLADDLDRFLGGYPVKAAPSRRVSVARKFIGRHRLAVGTVALVLASLVIGLAGTTWALRKAAIEAHRKQITADFLGSILASVDPDVSGELDKSLMLRVLDDAAQRAESELVGDPEELIAVQLTIAESYAGLGLPRKAIPLLESARAAARNQGSRGRLSDLLAAQRLGSALVDAGRFEESENVLREAIAGAQARRGQVPASLESDLRSRLSWTLRQRGKLEDALDQARRSYGELRASMPESHPQLLDAGGRLAILLSDLGHYDEAIALIREMIARRAEILGHDHPRTLSWRLSLAVFHLQQRDYAGGEAELKAMLGPVARQFGENSSMLAMVHGNLGGALRQQGKVEEAGPHYRFAYQFNLHQGGPEAPNTIMTRHNLANWLLDDGQVGAALSEQQACLELAERVFGQDHEVTSEVLRGLALAEIASGLLVDARQHLERALAIRVSLYGTAEGPLARLREALEQLAAAERDSMVPKEP